MSLSDKQVIAVTLLASGRTARSVAAEIRVTPQTICAWRKNPDFVAAVNSCQRETIESARVALQQAAAAAVDAIVELVRSAESEETRRKAANDILRMAGYEAASSANYARFVGPESADQVQARWALERELDRGRNPFLGGGASI
jgi:hypothetical protein